MSEWKECKLNDSIHISSREVLPKATTTIKIAMGTFY